MQSALPVESRPLLTLRDHDPRYSDDDDGDNDTNNRTNAPSTMAASGVFFSTQHHHNTNATKSGDAAAAASSANVDWLAVVRHTLADVTRSLPDARNSERRIKSCDHAITRIEAMRDEEEQPTLRRGVYTVPVDRTSAATEVGRVRATLEVVATRIRDAIAEDARRRLAQLPERLLAQHYSQSQQQNQMHQIQNEKQQTSFADAEVQHDNSENSHSSDLVIADLQERLTAASTVSQIATLEHNETLARHSIERGSDRELLDLVTSLLRTLDHYAVATRHRGEEQERKAKADADQQQQMRQQQHEVQQEQQKQRHDKQQRELLRAHEAHARSLIEEMEHAERAFNIADAQRRDLLQLQSTATARAASSARHQEASETTAAMLQSREEAQRQQYQQQEQQKQQRKEQLKRQLLQLEEFEHSERSLIAEWERDTLRHLVQLADGERSGIAGAAAAQKQVACARLQSSYFETWRCFALLRREENMRADRERHARILNYTLELQHSQLNGSLDAMSPYACFNDDNDDDEHDHNGAAAARGNVNDISVVSSNGGKPPLFGAFSSRAATALRHARSISPAPSYLQFTEHDSVRSRSPGLAVL